MNRDDLIELDMTPREVPVTLKRRVLRDGKAHEEVDHCILTELSESAAITVQNRKLELAVVENGQLIVKGIAKIEPLQVSLCLFKEERNGDGKCHRVQFATEEQVSSWANRVVEPLYRKIDELSASGDLASKKEPGASPDSSQ